MPPCTASRTPAVSGWTNSSENNLPIILPVYQNVKCLASKGAKLWIDFKFKPIPPYLWLKGKGDSGLKILLTAMT